MNLREIDGGSVISRLKGKPFVFCSALSFEERCVSVCEELVKGRVFPSVSFLYGYDTKADPAEEDSFLRDHYRRDMLGFLESHSEVEECQDLNPFSTTALRQSVARALNSSDCRRFVVDFTCMTRVHLLAWASVLSSLPELPAELYFCYTAPESYGLHRNERPGWRDTLLIPIGRPWSLRREGHSRGVILAGLDGERLSLALQELEPGTGCFVFAKTLGRPDLVRRAREANASVSERLLSLRMPRAGSSEQSAYESWKKAILAFTDFSYLAKLIAEQVEDACRDEGPVVLFPFGPKPLSLSAGLLLASEDRIDAWAVYPVPDKYSIEYTQGRAALHWMTISSSSVPSP